MGRSVIFVLALLELVSSSFGKPAALKSVKTLETVPLRPLQVSAHLPKLLPGLLARAETCPIGSGDPCGSKICCPIGGVCCSGEKSCCGAAQRCCPGGCCQLTEYCDTVDGVKGCCPVLAICTTKGTPTSTHTTKSASSTSRSTAATSTPLTNIPAAAAGSQNVVIDMSQPAISFSGQWADTVSSCNSSAKSKSIIPDSAGVAQYSTIAYSFTGSAIYMMMSSVNAHYTVALGTDFTEYYSGGTVAPPNCTYGWSRTGLLDNETRTVFITVYGSPDVVGNTWGVELHHFVITNKTSTSSSDPSSGGSGSGSGSDDDAGDDTGSSLRSNVDFLMLYIALCTGFVLLL
ncbi:hypothetical protein C8J57DRAFT_24372 [Mycena rebaudengoi]|nr:hypothetical protein C8J57DRAFT_24372 [Mycena rebaudengoi]